MTHTPGPWLFTGPTGYWVETPEKTPIAYLVCPVRITEPATPLHLVATEANGRLIAAAPELLEALKGVLRSLEIHLDEIAKANNLSVSEVCPCNENEIARARAAIAKATGGKL